MKSMDYSLNFLREIALQPTTYFVTCCHACKISFIFMMDESGFWPIQSATNEFSLLPIETCDSVLHRPKKYSCSYRWMQNVSLICICMHEQTVILCKRCVLFATRSNWNDCITNILAFFKNQIHPKRCSGVGKTLLKLIKC